MVAHAFPPLPRPGLATALGVGAVVLWSALALLTTWAGAIPPFELLTLSFGIAFLASVVVIAARQGVAGFRAWKQPWAAWLTGFLGIFLFHALYFFALQAAPPAEASLIVYLWPLLMVVMSAFTAGGKTSVWHLLGALLGLSGTALIVGGGAGFNGGAWVGYVEALGCALAWSSYSIANRRFRTSPSSMIGGVCGLVALAGLICHLSFEQTVLPSPQQGVILLGLGLGPLGVAFFAWDHATKHGIPAILGALSYLAPLLSTLLLIGFGLAAPSSTLLLAAVLTIAGSAVATLAPSLRRRPTAIAR